MAHSAVLVSDGATHSEAGSLVYGYGSGIDMHRIWALNICFGAISGEHGYMEYSGGMSGKTYVVVVGRAVISLSFAGVTMGLHGLLLLRNPRFMAAGLGDSS